MSDQIQNLSLEALEKASEKYSNIKEVYISLEIDGNIVPYKVEMYKYFSPISISQCVAELIEKLDMVRARDKYGLGDIFMPYLMFLIIKHFTTLELPEEFSKQLKAIEHMTNTGTLFQIFSHFDEEEVMKIKDQIHFVVDNFNKKLPEIEKMKEEIKDKLVNKDLVE